MQYKSTFKLEQAEVTKKELLELYGSPPFDYTADVTYVKSIFPGNPVPEFEFNGLHFVFDCIAISELGLFVARYKTRK